MLIYIMMTFSEESSSPIMRIPHKKIRFVRLLFTGIGIIAIVIFGSTLIKSSHKEVTQFSGTQTGIAQGTIVNSIGNPVAGANITIRDNKDRVIASLTTDNQGYYEQYVPSGDYKLKVYANGQEVTSNITVSQNGTIGGNIQLNISTQ